MPEGDGRRYQVIPWRDEVGVVDTLTDIKVASFWSGFDGQRHPDPVAAAEMEAERLNAQQPVP